MSVPAALRCWVFSVLIWKVQGANVKVSERNQCGGSQDDSLLRRESIGKVTHMLDRNDIVNIGTAAKNHLPMTFCIGSQPFRVIEIMKFEEFSPDGCLDNGLLCEATAVFRLRHAALAQIPRSDLVLKIQELSNTTQARSMIQSLSLSTSVDESWGLHQRNVQDCMQSLSGLPGFPTLRGKSFRVLGVPGIHENLDFVGMSVDFIPGRELLDPLPGDSVIPWLCSHRAPLVRIVAQHGFAVGDWNSWNYKVIGGERCFDLISNKPDGHCLEKVKARLVRFDFDNCVRWGHGKSYDLLRQFHRRCGVEDDGTRFSNAIIAMENDWIDLTCRRPADDSWSTLQCNNSIPM
eukprot:TRINITY_DN24554_c0_g1_i1.p1 TRINITY_DN24554_c0_g1~~TRINITY_DN24554_c0_g1_i1.p1  ORF type:complete len:348 (+),score=34.47 TRINITY_DN24554_c0_g1_i1:46-1089(+)